MSYDERIRLVLFCFELEARSLVLHRFLCSSVGQSGLSWSIPQNFEFLRLHRQFGQSLALVPFRYVLFTLYALYAYHTRLVSLCLDSWARDLPDCIRDVLLSLAMSVPPCGF